MLTVFLIISRTIFFSKLPIESTPVLYEVNQLRNEISRPKNKVQKKFFDNPNLIERTIISYDHIQDLDLYYNLNERKNLYDVCQKERYVILLGDAGCGKTIALRQTAHYACDKYYTLFISLSDYAGGEINNLICNEYPEYENLSLFLIFDAFDEIRENDRYTFARKLNSFVERYKNAIVLVSARNNFYKFADENGEGSTLKQFKEYALCPLTQNDIIVYSENEGIDYNNFNSELYRHRLLSIVYNPFYLKILVELMKENSHLPSKKELMDEIIKKSFKFDKKKYVNPPIIDGDEHKLMLLLQKIAFSMQCMGDKVRIGELDYQSLFDKNERALISYSSLFFINSNDQWQFEHNNFREYLAAKYLCNLDIEEIKEVICYDTEKSKIRNSWVNVISYLMLIYEDDDLINWLNEVSESLLVKVERSRIGENLCNDIFKRIFNSFADKNAWITHGNNSIEELVGFAQSRETLDFLMDEIRNPQNRWSLSNALVLIAIYNSTLFEKRDDVRNTLKNCILSSSTDDYQKRLAMTALAELELNTDEVTELLISLFNAKQTDEIRYGVVCYIVDSNIYEEHIDFLMQQWQYSKPHYDNDNAINIIYKVEMAFENTHKKEAVRTLIKYFYDLSYCDFRNSEIYSYIIKQAISFYKNGDDSFFTDILNSVITTKICYSANLKQLCLEFFSQTNTKQRAFQEILKYFIQNPDKLFVIRILIDLADNENVEFLKKCYTENQEKYGDVFKTFTANLSYNNTYLNECINLLKSNGITVEFSNAPINYDELKNKALQTYFNSLFDKVEYQKLVDALIKYFDNENVTCGEVWEIFWNTYDYNNLNHEILFYIVHDIHAYISEDSTICNFVENIKSWKRFSICKIYRILSQRDNNIIVSKEQQTIIREFCDNQIQSAKLNDEITGGNDESCTYNLKLFCFFSSYFSFKYSKEITKELTVLPKHLFDKVYDNDCIFSEYITENLSNEELFECVKYNINNHTLRLSSQIEHIKFCKQHNKNYALKLAKQICFDPQIDEYDKRVALEYFDAIFKDSENNYKYIYSMFLETNDEKLLNAIVDVTIRGNSPLLIKRLEEENKKSDNKEKYLTELIKLQSQYGLKRYYEIAKEKMSIPDYNNKNQYITTEIISEISSVELIPILIELKDLLFTEGFEDVKFFGLYNSLLHAFQNIAIEHNDEVIHALGECTQNPNITPNDKAFCNRLISDIEMQVKNRKDIPWTIKKIKIFLKEHEL